MNRDKNERRHSNHRAKKNGYALIQSLIIFGLVSMFTLSASLCAIKAGWLSKALRQNEQDLQIVYQAKEMARENSYKRRCGYVMDAEDLNRRFVLEGQNVWMEDRETFIEITVSHSSQNVIYRLYYDQNGISELRVQS